MPTVVPEVARWLAARPDASASFVDDGSRDGTPEAIAEEIARAVAGSRALEGRLRLERSPENRGKGAVLREAMLASRAEIICFTDGDLAYSLDHVDRLLAALDGSGADAAIGSRGLVPGESAKPAFKRRFTGSIFNLAVRLVLGLTYTDTQAGLKGFRAAAAKRIFGRSRVDGFAFDAEVLYLARLEGLRVVEIPATVASGHASLGSTVSLLVDPWRMLWALLRIRRMHRAGRRAAPSPAL